MSRNKHYGKKTVDFVLLTAQTIIFSSCIGGCSVFKQQSIESRVLLTAFKGLLATHERTIKQEIFPCQIGNFGANEDQWERSVAENANPISLFILIENQSDYELRIPSEAYSVGYYCLELDINVDDEIHTARKKAGAVWNRNLPNEDILLPGGKIMYPVVLDERIWDYVPPSKIDLSELRKISAPYLIRPRLKGASIFVDGQRMCLADIVGNWTTIGNEVSEGTIFDPRKAP